MTKDSIYRRIIKAFRSLKYGNFRLWDKNRVEEVLFDRNDLVLHYGKDEPDSVFYFIDLSSYDCGFFGQYSRIIHYLEIADQHGWKPIIQMSKHMYVVKGNTYDYIYEQPFEKKPEDVKEKKVPENIVEVSSKCNLF